MHFDIITKPFTDLIEELVKELGRVGKLMTQFELLIVRSF